MGTDILDVVEWMRYGQGDYDCAIVFSRENNPYAPQKVSYDCQQSAEKVLKAYLIAKEGFCSQTHNIVGLLNRCKQHSADFDTLNVQCSSLNMFQVASRYPSQMKLTLADMEQSLKSARDVLEFTKSKLKELGYGS
jgi:HEPN domain-containing protein